MEFEQLFRVNWSDLDGNAHMGNSSYLDYAADTRFLFFAKQGFTRFAQEKIGPVITRDELIYRKELRLMDEFRVDLEAVGVSQDGMKFRLRNTFRNTVNGVVATVTSDGVWFDLERRRPRAPPPDLDNIMRNLKRNDDYSEILLLPSTNNSGTTSL